MIDESLSPLDKCFSILSAICIPCYVAHVLTLVCAHTLVVANTENAEPIVNGDTGSESSGEVERGPRKQDTIMITGKEENCQGAKDALLVRTRHNAPLK